MRIVFASWAGPFGRISRYELSIRWPRDMMAMLATLSAYADNPQRYREVAMHGDYESQRNYAYILASGDGVAQNMIEACVHMRHSA